MKMNCVKCNKLHEYMIRIAVGVRWSGDPEDSMRYSSYANGMIEERYICPLCLKDQIFPPLMDTSRGVPVDELQEDKDDAGTDP
jgi:hypothetical protein